jgi:LysR family glycine cleavage system transcriptional activator
MAIARRFLPSVPIMCAFEAAARHESFTLAAAELNLTQSAVSRQIRSLETLLGFDLFLREKQTVRLTLAGESYAREIREALLHIANATLGLRANPKGGTLNLAVLPSFAARWLAPRLPRFQAEQPAITLNLLTRLAPVRFDQDQVDAAIYFGEASWPGAQRVPLMGETVIPVCNPTLAGRYRFQHPADLLAAPLLHLTSRPDAWEGWFAAKGVSHAPLSGMLFDQFSVLAGAAIAGLGLALLPRFLFTDELMRGALVEAVFEPLTLEARYHLAWPAAHANHYPLQAFRDWLLREISAD